MQCNEDGKSLCLSVVRYRNDNFKTFFLARLQDYNIARLQYCMIAKCDAEYISSIC